MQIHLLSSHEHSWAVFDEQALAELEPKDYDQSGRRSQLLAICQGDPRNCGAVMIEDVRTRGNTLATSANT